MQLNQLMANGLDQSHLTSFLDEGVEFKLHPEVANSFQKMKESYHRDTGNQVAIVSAHRDFHRQHQIVSDKLVGKRVITDDAGNAVSIDELSVNELVVKVLRFSALPGFSRHHFGSDIDVFDCREMERSQVQLVASEWEAGAPNDRLNQWLQENINHFGFERPFSEDHGGVAVEKWHLSYCAIARELQDFWTSENLFHLLKNFPLPHNEFFLQNSEEIYRRYVLNQANAK